MARRRSKFNFQQAFAPLQQMLQIYAQHQLTKERQAEDDFRQAGIRNVEAQRNTAQSLIPQIASGQLNPDNIPPELLEQLPYDLRRFRPSDEQLSTPIADQIRTAKTQVDVPTEESIFAGLKSRGIDTDPVLGAPTAAETPDGGLPSFNRPIESAPMMQALRGQRQGQLSSINQAQELEMERKGAEAFLTNQQSVIGKEAGEQVASQTRDPRELALLENKGMVENTNRLALERNLTPIMVDRTRREAQARFNVEWGDGAIAQKMKYEQQKAVQEALAAGNRQRIEALSTRNAAIEALMPLYDQYKRLVNEVTTHPYLATSPASKSAQNTIAKIPWVGEMLASGMDSAAIMAFDTLEAIGAQDPGFAQKMQELTAITDALAQGMANAVLGNRGQTTENDRRTAKNLLATLANDAQTAQEMLLITDRMFTIVPTMAATIAPDGSLVKEDDGTVGRILEAAAQQVRSELQQVRQSQAGGNLNTPSAPAAPAGPPASVTSIMSR